MLIGEIQQKTILGFRIDDDFETYINAIHVDYDSGDVIFTGWLYILNTPEIIRINRSQPGRGTGFKRDLVEIIGSIRYILTSGNCF